MISWTTTLRRAAALLREDAQAGFESCQILSDPLRAWACADCNKIEGRCIFQRQHDECLQLAAKLDLMAEVS